MNQNEQTQNDPTIGQTAFGLVVLCAITYSSYKLGEAVGTKIDQIRYRRQFKKLEKLQNA